MRAALLLASSWAVAACGTAATEEDSSTDVPAEADAEADAAPADTDAGPDGPDGIDAADGDIGPDTPADADAEREDAPAEEDGVEAAEDGGPPDGEAGDADGSEDGTTEAVDGGGAVEATMTSVEAWTVIFMGSGSHAVFTLELRNTGGSEVTGFHAVSGKVTGAGGAELFTFTGPSELNVGSTGGPVFDGRVTAGGSATVAGHGFDLAVTLGTRCSEDVSLSLDVAWDGGAASVLGGPTSLMCVSK